LAIEELQEAMAYRGAEPLIAVDGSEVSIVGNGVSPGAVAHWEAV
jgi:hypothetical protein